MSNMIDADDLTERLTDKARTLREMARIQDVDIPAGSRMEAKRLYGKAEGVLLALEDIRQAIAMRAHPSHCCASCNGVERKLLPTRSLDDTQ